MLIDFSESGREGEGEREREREKGREKHQLFALPLGTEHRTQACA